MIRRSFAQLWDLASAAATPALFIAAGTYAYKSWNNPSDMLVFWIALLILMPVLSLCVYLIKDFKDQESKYVRRFDLRWLILIGAGFLVSLFFAHQNWHASAEAKAEADKLVVYVMPIDKIKMHDKPSGDKPWEQGGVGVRLLAREVGNKETYIQVPCQLYFEMMKNPKVSSVAIRGVHLNVLKYEKGFAKPMEQMQETTHFRPSIRMQAFLGPKETKTECFKVNPEPGLRGMLDDHPCPISIDVDCREGGLYTVACEVEVSHGKRWDTIPVEGAVNLYKQHVLKSEPITKPTPKAEPVPPPVKEKRTE